MSDVTLSYKGSDILELSDSGSATLKTGGTYCEADIEVEYVKPSGGGSARYVEGTFTLASDAASPTISHNLGTEKIAGFVIPHYEIVAHSGYRNYFSFFVNWRAFISDDETWIKDFTPYNAKRHPNPYTVTSNAIKSRIADMGYASPWTTQGDQWQGSYNAGLIVTENTFQVGTGSAWASGTYYYRVFALE